MRHVYHYCAQYQVAPGSIGYIDGIARMVGKIEDMDSYRALKKAICENNAPTTLDALVITSLSYHGVESVGNKNISSETN